MTRYLDHEQPREHASKNPYQLTRLERIAKNDLLALVRCSLVSKDPSRIKNISEFNSRIATTSAERVARRDMLARFRLSLVVKDSGRVDRLFAFNKRIVQSLD